MSPRRKERWYSIEGQRHSHRRAMDSSKGSRHLISLIVLLVLTLIAIRQVSDPKRVERVATAVGLLRTSQNSDPQPPRLPTASQENLPEDPQLVSWTLVSSQPAMETQAQIFERLMDLAPPGLVSAMAYQDLIARDSKIPTRPIPENELRDRAEWLASSKERVTRWIELSDSMSAEHELLSSIWTFLDRMSESSAREDPVPEEGQQAPLAFQLALERALVGQFADNTPWRSSDRNPLMRSTQRAVLLGEAFRSGKLVPEILPAIAVPQLMGDIDALRGRAVRISGRIALIDQNASLAVEDPKIRTYQVLWLRPDDGSNQPIIIHVPSSLDIPADRIKKDASMVVSGIVTKRRAYASNRGGDIAPVVVASHLQPLEPRDPATPAILSEEQQSLALRWQKTQAAKPWTPPVDIGGALQRIEQRIGKRARDLQAHLMQVDLADPERIDTLARDEQVQAILVGLQQVAEELQLLSQANWNPIDTDALPLKTRRGLVTQVRRIAIEKEPFPGWQWKELYACALQSTPDDNEGSHGIVFTHHIPNLWREAASLRQPVIATGLIFQAQGNSGTEFMISPSLEWRKPDDEPSSELAPHLPLGWKSLLDRGWNLNWIDMLESLQGKPMTARESEPFYRLLRCSNSPLASGTDPSELVLSVMQAIQRAETGKSNRRSTANDTSSSGHRAQGTVQIRRVQRIEVSDPDQQNWLGADHYYQLDGFADIGPNRITIRYEETDQPLVFEKEFPITLVARKVPESLLIEADDALPGQTQAWYPRTRVAVAGWFYRMWRFKTTQVSEATQGKESQLGPMMVIDRFEAAAPPAIEGASKMSPTWVKAIALMIGVLGGLWILLQIRQGIRNPRSRR